MTTIIDSGLFHVWTDEERPRYAASIGSVLAPGGHLYLMCFSDRQPGDWGPRRVHQEELRAVFADGWAVESITADTFDVNPIARHHDRRGLARRHPQDLTTRPTATPAPQLPHGDHRFPCILGRSLQPRGGSWQRKRPTLAARPTPNF